MSTLLQTDSAHAVIDKPSGSNSDIRGIAALEIACSSGTSENPLAAQAHAKLDRCFCYISVHMRIDDEAIEVQRGMSGNERTDIDHAKFARP